MSRTSRLLPVFLVVVGFAAFLAFVLLIVLGRLNTEIYVAPRADDDNQLVPLHASAIKNGFRALGHQAHTRRSSI
jgi:hypothetical protein